MNIHFFDTGPPENFPQPTYVWFSKFFEPAQSFKGGSSSSSWVTDQRIWKEVDSSFANYKRLISVARQAVISLIQGKLPDPSYVGENACQIRAVMYADAVMSNTLCTALTDALVRFQIVRENFEKCPPLSCRKGKFSLKEVLMEHSLDFPIDERIYHFVLGYVLNVHEGSTDRFKKEGDLVQPADDKKTSTILAERYGFTGLKDLIKLFKKKLAYTSVIAVQQMACSLPKEQCDRYLPMVSGNQVKETAAGLSVIPCFSGAKILFAYARAKKIPIVIKAHQIDRDTAEKKGETLLFFSVQKSAEYKIAQYSDFEEFQGAILVEGITLDLRSGLPNTELLNRPIVESLMAFMAVHPSYGGDLKREAGPETGEDDRPLYAANAEAWGCSVNNPSVFRPFHISAIFIRACCPEGLEQ